jgi:diguanylate cyclase (GGDEF)-like protein/PAS domain S-box-containing protein
MPIKINCTFYFLYVFSSLIFCITPSLAADKLKLGSFLNQPSISLTQYFDVLEDSTQNLTLADVQNSAIASTFKSSLGAGEALGLGYTASAYWLRLSIHNDTDAELVKFLEIGYSNLSTVQLYQNNKTNTPHATLTGSALPFNTRAYAHHYFIFPLKLAPHTTQVLHLRLQSIDSLLVPARLWEPQAFHKYERTDYNFQALYFGMAIAMILFNLLLFLVLKESIYLLYVVFVFFSTLTLAAQNGLAQQYIWPHASSWPNIANFIGFSVSIAALLFFMRAMLSTRQTYPKLDRWIKGFIFLHFLAAIAILVDAQKFSPTVVILNLSSAFLILGSGIYAASRQQRSAYFFVTAFAMIILGGILTIMRSFGLLPTNMLTLNAMQFGSALEMVLLALALADRFNVARREKAQAQRDALTAQQKLVEALQSSEKELESRVAERTAELRIAATAFESHECSIVTDADGIILKVNSAFTEMTGYSAKEVTGQTTRILKSGLHDPAFYDGMWARILNSGSWQGEIWNRHKSGEIFSKWLTINAVKNDNGIITHYVGTLQDITDRKVAEDRIAELAFFDPVTNLPNRTLLKDRLKQTMTAGNRSGTYGAVLMLDLDHFKTLNDTLGHAKGDLLLQLVATRLLSSVREEDTVSRLGGDEFVVILGNLSDFADEAAKFTELIGNKLLKILQQPYELGELDHINSASIGATLFKGHSASIDDLLKQADLAMYKSKDSGRNNFHFFDIAMESAIMQRFSLESAMSIALEDNQYLLHYQPQMLGESHVTGAEVLVRWQHPQRGMVSPAEFIPLAEASGFILPLGRWVLSSACIQLAAWSTQPEVSHLTLAVNVSARQFRQTNFVDQVLDIISETGANPHKLKLELTESLLVENVQDIIDKMSKLKSQGVRFSLDDFGTGYSSLTYLKRLPLFQLKIDQSFVRDIMVDANDAAIAQTIVTLAQSLGLEVIAEGVETEAQRDFLARSGCQAFQGYLYSRPLPLAGFEEYVRKKSILS